MELEWSKPLVSKVILNGKTIFMECKSLHFICFKCERNGHIDEHCPEQEKVGVAKKNIVEKDNTESQLDGGNGVKNSPIDQPDSYYGPYKVFRV